MNKASVCVSFLISLLGFVNLALSTPGIIPEKTITDEFIHMAPQLDVAAYVLLDMDTRVILAEHNADERIDPVGLTKMMTAYLADQTLTRGDISRGQLVPISPAAAHIDGVHMLNENNIEVPVGDLLQGIVVLSANDASVALAEFIAGDEKGFTDLMNQEARRLGMRNTHFENSHGLANPGQYSSAHDLAILARALIEDFPETYPQYGQKEYTYNGITRTNPNLLLSLDASVDGIKTGYSKTQGYSLVSSAKRQGKRLLAVVISAQSAAARVDLSRILLDYGFKLVKMKAPGIEG